MADREDTLRDSSSDRMPWRADPTMEPSRAPSDDHLVYSDDDSLSDAYFFQPRSEDPLTLSYSPENRNGKQWHAENALYYGDEREALHPSFTPVYTYGSVEGPDPSVLTMEDHGYARQELSQTSGNQQIPEQQLAQQHGRVASAPESRTYRQLRQKQMEQGQRERAVKRIRGKPQDASSCRDMAFAAVFLLQLLLVFIAAAKFGSNVVTFDGNWTPWSRMSILEHDSSVGGLVSQVETANDDFLLSNMQGATMTPISHSTTSAAAPSLFTIDYQTVISLCGITGLYACILSLFTVGFMLIIAKALIQVSLILSIMLALAWGIIGYAIQPHGVVPIMGFVALFLLLTYTMVMWNRIPFAATNLYTALCAMRCTADITLIGVGMLFVAFVWCIIWGMAFIGIVDTLDQCSPGDLFCQESMPHSHILLYIALLFSFAWTNLVIKNIVRVTVASAVGTFWFRPQEISPCCTSAVSKPFFRAITTSLGSICLGSLVVLPSQIVRAITWVCCVSIFRFNPPRQHNSKDRSCCGVFGIIRRYFLRCNRWSFCYIGMYGYSFAEAGDKAIQLFETRGWMSVVQDNLIHNVLFLASLVIGGSTGTFGVVVEEVDGYTFTSFHQPVITAFTLGSVLGFVLSNVLLLGVVGSAVNTILVCFAAGPFEFHQNHPRLSQEMRDVWSQQVFEPTV